MEITAGAQARLPKPEVQPVDLAQRMETKVEMLAQRLYEKRKEMHRLIGEKTYKGKEVSVEARREEFSTLKSSPDLLFQTIVDNTMIGANGELRVNRKLLDAFEELGNAGAT